MEEKISELQQIGKALLKCPVNSSLFHIKQQVFVDIMQLRMLDDQEESEEEEEEPDVAEEHQQVLLEEFENGANWKVLSWLRHLQDFSV